MIKISQNPAYSMEKQAEQNHSVRAQVMEFDVSIWNMVGLMFKWIVASIPVGIVLWVLWYLVVMMIAASKY